MWEAHDWKLKSHAMLSISRVFRGKGLPARYPWDFLLGDFLNVTFLPFTHTICTLITHKCKGGHSERKTLDRFLYNTHTHLLKRELLILSEEIILASSPFLFHCHTLKGDLYTNTTHTFSECRECFGAWKILRIFQKKPVRLGGCNLAYCGIRKVRQDTVPRSLVRVVAWRA